MVRCSICFLCIVEKWTERKELVSVIELLNNSPNEQWGGAKGGRDVFGRLCTHINTFIGMHWAHTHTHKYFSLHSMYVHHGS